MIISLTCLAAYPIVIQYKRGGWYSFLKPAALVVAALDVLANYTEWYFVFGKTPEGAHTISQRLAWMQLNEKQESKRAFAKLLITILDACEHDGDH